MRTSDQMISDLSIISRICCATFCAALPINSACQKKANVNRMEVKSVPNAAHYAHAPDAKITVFCRSDEHQVGLLLEILTPVVWKSRTSAHFTYRVTNFTDDEIFLETPNAHEVGCSYDGPEGFATGGVGSGITWLDNFHPLRRLTDNGVDGCYADVKAFTLVPFFASDKGSTNVSIRMVGFYRSNGARFEEFVDLPLPLDGRPSGSGQ